MTISPVITTIYNAIFKTKTRKAWDDFAQVKIDEYRKKGVSELDAKSELRYYNLLLADYAELLGRKNFSGFKVLEPGSGMGLLTIFMAKYGAKGWVLDRSEKWIAYAKILGRLMKKQGSFEGQMKYLTIDFLDEKFLNKHFGFFDIVHNEGVIEHGTIGFATNFVKKMAVVTKEEGKVIVAVPNFFSPDAIAIFGSYRKMDEIYYNRRMLKKVLINAGLYDVKVITSAYSFPHWLYPSLNNISPGTEKIFGRMGFGFLHIGIGTKRRRTPKR